MWQQICKRKSFGHLISVTGCIQECLCIFLGKPSSWGVWGGSLFVVLGLFLLFFFILKCRVLCELNLLSQHAILLQLESQPLQHHHPWEENKKSLTSGSQPPCSLIWISSNLMGKMKTVKKKKKKVKKRKKSIENRINGFMKSLLCYHKKAKERVLNTDKLTLKGPESQNTEIIWRLY